MNIHTLAARLSIAGHHDLVEELLSVHLNESMTPAKLGAGAGDVDELDALLAATASSWLAATHAAHSVEDIEISRDLMSFAQAELREVVLINDEIRKQGSASIVQINPVHISADSGPEETIEFVLARAGAGEGADNLHTAKLNLKKRKEVMLQWEALKRHSPTLPVPQKADYDRRYHQKLARFFRSKQFNVVEKTLPGKKFGIYIEVPNLNKAKMESNRLNKYVPLQKKTKDGTHFHGLPNGIVAITIRDR